MARVKEDEMIQRVMGKDEMPYKDEKMTVELILETHPNLAPQLVRIYFEKSRKCLEMIQAWKETDAELRNTVKSLTDPPWYPCEFLRYSKTHQKAMVMTDRKVYVSIAPDLQKEVPELKPGSQLLLNSGMNCIIGADPDDVKTGAVGEFLRYHGNKGVIQGGSDQEIVVDLSCPIAELTLKRGDRVMFDPIHRIAYEKIEKREGEELRLEEVPKVSFEEIGGLDEVIESLLVEIEMHLHHPEVVRRHGLKRAKGVLLSGPPGCGKTMIAKAIAHHVSKLSNGGRSCFLNIPPGSHRSMWYGQSEEKIREIFRTARDGASGSGVPVILFFDELDGIGSRQNDPVNAIDGRVLTSFLAAIDGIEETENLFLIGATNRADLIDEALLRPGRFGEKIIEIPRPNRAAAEEIFKKHLPADLPYAGDGDDPSERREMLIGAAVSYLYAPNGEGNRLATLVLRDGQRRELFAPEVVSGAFLANVAREAKKRSCLRAMQGLGEGISPEDLFSAIDAGLEEITGRMKKLRGIDAILTDLPNAYEVVRVELPERRGETAGHRYLRSV